MLRDLFDEKKVLKKMENMLDKMKEIEEYRFQQACPEEGGA